MALSQKQELRTSQSLVMTPQLQQAIKLLQLTNLELDAFVERELEQNPVLERAEGEPAVEGETPAGAGGGESAVEAMGEIEVDHVDYSGGTAEAEAPLDTDDENGFTHGEAIEHGGGAAAELERAAWSGLGGGGNYEGEGGGIDAAPDAAISLKEHLLGQINTGLEDPVDRLIGAHLVESLDEAGYLTEDVGEVAAKLGCPARRVETVLAALQQMDPIGIGARNLAECLALQLGERDRLDPAMRTLLDHLDLLARHDFDALRRLCAVDAEDMAEMIGEIRALNPKPGLLFDYAVAAPIVPDVLVRREPDGAWRIELNTETLPRVLVNARYSALVRHMDRGSTERAYLTECLNNANWLVKSLDQRARTILKVSSEIVRQQEGFLEHGVDLLRPLNLRTVAEAIEMHESTISRVTSNKYVETPRGIFELKYFFTSAIASAAGGDALSAEAVKHRIRALIDGEDGGAVHSDDRLVTLLRESGADIARRTVAKYRESMAIPSSVQRRRIKRASLWEAG